MNIKGFKDIQSDKDKKGNDNKKTNDWYTGGQSSGLNVENPDENGNKNKIKLTKWRNGFQIDDGPFRDLSAPENQKFMEEVEEGYIPKELEKKGYKDLGIMLEDKK